MRPALAKLGLGVDVPLGFNDGYALAMREDRAAALGIRKLSDLVRHPELKLGLSNEFIGRADGWPGSPKRYGLPQAADRPGPRARLRRARRRPGRRDRHLHHRRADRPPRTARARGRPATSRATTRCCCTALDLPQRARRPGPRVRGSRARIDEAR
jgi:hypothetical protein